MKKLLKILLWVLGIFSGLIILLVIAFKLFFPVEKAKAYAIEKAEFYLGRDVSIETIDISIWGGLGLQLVDVKVANPEEFGEGHFLTARNVDVKVRFWPLLSGEFQIDRFILNDPNIRMTKLVDGRINYAFSPKDTSIAKAIPEDMPRESAPAAAAISFDRFEINGGRLDFKDDSSNVNIRLVGLGFRSTLLNPQKYVYLSSGGMAVDSLIFIGDEPWPSMAIDMAYDAELNLDRDRLTIRKSHFDLNKMRLSIEGEILDLSKELNGRVSITGDQILAEQVIHMLPSSKKKFIDEYSILGKINLDIDIEYHSQKADPFYYAGTINLSDVSLKYADVDGEFKFKQALIDFKPDNVRVNIDGGEFNNQPFKGHLVLNNFDNPFINGDITGSTDIAIFQPLLEKNGNLKLAGNANIDLRFSGEIKDKKNFKYTGNLNMAGGKFSSSVLPETIDNLTLDLFFDNEVTNVRKITAKSKSAGINFTGRFEHVLNYYMADSADRPKMKRPVITGNLSGKASVAVLNKYLEEKRGGQMKGNVEFNLQVSGSPVNLSGLKPHGAMTISGAALKDTLLPEPIQELSAQLTIVEDTFKVDSMTVRFISSDVSLKGRIIKPVPYFLTYLGVTQGEPQKPLFELNVKSRRFDVDKMFPEAVPGSEAVTDKTATTTEPSMAVPDMNGTGTFAIDSLIYSKIEFTNIKGGFRVQDRKMECHNVTGNVYSGKVDGETIIDLNDFASPKYTGNFKATDVEADDFVKRFSKFGGFLYGKIDVNGTYKAAGWNKNEFVNSLTMDGLAQMNRGKLVTSGASFEALKGIASSLSLQFDQEQAIRSLATKLTVKEGKVGLDNLKTTLGQVGDMELGGFYDFNGGLDYHGSILLSADYTKKMLSFLTKGDILAGLSGLFTDKSVDRMRLPIVIEGSVDDPKVKVDLGTLGRTGSENLKNKLSGFLQDQFKKENKK
jgi:hypothetical protein